LSTRHSPTIASDQWYNSSVVIVGARIVVKACCRHVIPHYYCSWLLHTDRLSWKKC